MRLVAAVAALAGCSFVAVQGPPPEYDAKTVTCTDSDVVPSIDSAAGVLAIAAAAGGEIVTQAGVEHVDNYELIYGIPLIIVGIVYLVAASRGTDKVEACRSAKQVDNVGCDGCAERVP
jgi:hypothetical protein|nr:hypothetical protein [Kofleriaceae bacterium]